MGFSPKRKIGDKPTENDKKIISDFFQPLVEEFKTKIKPPPEDKNQNYLIDIYSKWYQSYFYITEKWKSEDIYRTRDEWEINVVRLKYKGKDCFDFSYLRHTEQWMLIATDLTMQNCKEMIMEDPNFQPMVF